MSSQPNFCQVCGRDLMRLEGELGIDPELEKDQNIWKCSKCINEYEIGIGRLTRGSGQKMNSRKSSKLDWKEQIVA